MELSSSAAAAAASAPSILEELKKIEERQIQRLTEHDNRQREHEQKLKYEVVKGIKASLEQHQERVVNDVKRNIAAKVSLLEQQIKSVQMTGKGVEKTCMEIKKGLAAIRGIVAKVELTCNQTRDSVASLGTKLAVLEERVLPTINDDDDADGNDDEIDDAITKPPSFVMPMTTTATPTVKSESDNPQTNNDNNNTIQTGTKKENRKKKKKRKVSHTVAAVADVTSSSSPFFPGPDHVVSSLSSSSRSSLHSGNISSNTINNNIFAELKKIEQQQQELKKESKKMQDVMTAKISSLEQTVEALRQQQPSNQQHQQTTQEDITGIDDNGSNNENSNNNESETDDNEIENANGDGNSDDNDGDNNVHADEENGNEIENTNEIIDISSSSSNNGDDDDEDDDLIENDGEECNVDDEECSDEEEEILPRSIHTAATAAVAAPGATVLYDEDTNGSYFETWKQKYDVLQKYVKSNNGSIPVKRYKNKKDGFLLGFWVDKQKKAYRNILSGRHSTRRITKPRVEYLEQIPNWTWGEQVSLLAEKEFADDEHTRNNNRALLKEEDTNSQLFKHWKRRYGILKEYVKSNNGQLPIKAYKNERDEFALGQWVTTQKCAYWNEIKGRLRKGRSWMTKPRAKWLESIPNWTWGACCVGGTKEQRDSINDTNTNNDDADELDDDVIVTKIVTSKSQVSRKRCSQDNDDETDSDCSSRNSDENTACRKGKKKTKMNHRKKKKENKERESERRRYDDEKKDDNVDGECNSHENKNGVHVDVKDGKEIQNNNEIIDTSSSSSNSREDDDDDDWIENNCDKYNVGGDTGTTAAATAALLNSSTFYDEDPNNIHFKAWKQKYDVLQMYVNSNFGCIPVSRYKDKKDRFALGKWVDHQKQAYRTIISGRPSSRRMMTNPRIEYLEQIPNWTWGKTPIKGIP